MGLLTRYLSTQVLTRFAVALVGLVAFLLSLDLMVNAERVADSRDGSVLDLLEYAALRIPEITSNLIKFASLLAALLTFTAMMRRNEVAPVWSMGVSQFGLMGRLLPVALLLGLFQFGIDDWLVPSANSVLRDWDIVQEPSASPGRAAWLYVGDDVVRVPFGSVGRDNLRDITIFERDPVGNLTARLEVREARYDGSGWQLIGVERREIGAAEVVEEMVLAWDTSLDPESLLRLTLHPREINYFDLYRIIDADRRGYWLPHYYRTWLNAKLAICFVPALMLFLIVALAQRFQRTGHVEFLFVGGLGYGFGYFIFSGISVAMGEVGLLPPWLAGWVPVIVFSLVITSIAFWREVHEPVDADDDGGSS